MLFYLDFVYLDSLMVSTGFWKTKHYVSIARRQLAEIMRFSGKNFNWNFKAEINTQQTAADFACPLDVYSNVCDIKYQEAQVDGSLLTGSRCCTALIHAHEIL